jgi:hypothetical protein
MLKYQEKIKAGYSQIIWKMWKWISEARQHFADKIKVKGKAEP